jgi:hypothetical protein
MHLLVLFEIKPKMLYKLNHLSLIKVKKQSLKFLTNIYLKPLASLFKEKKLETRKIRK